MYKFALIVTFTLFYLRCSFALPESPTTTAPSPNESTTQTASIAQRLRKRITSLFDPVFGWFSNMLEGFVKPFKMVGGLTLRLEFVAIAKNDHLAFPEQVSDVDTKEHRTAKAITVLWQNLRSMETVDEVLVNVTDRLVGTAILDSDNATKLLFDELDSKLRAYPEIYEELNDLKSRLSVENSTHGSLARKIDSDDKKALQEFLRHPFVAKLIYNKRFILSSKKFAAIKKDQAAFNNYVLARSILRLARNSTEMSTKLQGIYDEVLTNVVAVVDPVENLEDGVVSLFVELKLKILREEKLQKEIDLIKPEVIANAGTDYTDENNFEKYLIL